MEPRVLKTESQYEQALSVVEDLVAADPEPGTEEAQRLELFMLLVSQYEKERFVFELPSPLSAIQFRMEQQGLSQKDLVPYLGSRSKVSEVLAGKRPLTLSMIRALHHGLGIPAGVLLQQPGGQIPEDLPVDWRRFPLQLMAERKWIQATAQDLRDRGEELVRAFAGEQLVSGRVPAYCRAGNVRAAQGMDEYGLMAWCMRVHHVAAARKPPCVYQKGTVTREFLVVVAQLSWSERGPLLAVEFLAQHGIVVVVEPHLPRTHLDGAVFMNLEGTPVVGLTLRHDRLDNFWFTLLHELSHVALHLVSAEDSFIDDLDYHDESDLREREADAMASEALIPSHARLLASRAYVQKTSEAVREFASRLRVHPAVVAGQIRHQSRNFRVLSQLVGTGMVRKLFREVSWPD